MKKRISALVLSSCLLAGCAGQGAAATGETAAPSQAVPTAAPQSLTVNGLLDTSAAVGALELYAQAQNVTLQNSFETETADLDRKSTRLNSSHPLSSRMPSSA